MNVLKSLSIHGLAVVTALNFMPVNAFAQSQSLDDCSYLVPSRAAGQPIGSIIAVAGQVQVSGATGFSDSKVGAMLIGGNRLFVGPRSSASLLLGNKCVLRVSENQDVALDSFKSKICVRVLDRTATASAELPTLKTTSSFAFGVPFLLEEVTTIGLGTSSVVVPTSAVRAGIKLPVPESPNYAAATLGTVRATHAAINDNDDDGASYGVPLDASGVPTCTPHLEVRRVPADTGASDGIGNSIAVVVLGLAGVGGIVALALSGGESSVSD